MGTHPCSAPVATRGIWGCWAGAQRGDGSVDEANPITGNICPLQDPLSFKSLIWWRLCFLSTLPLSSVSALLAHSGLVQMFLGTTEALGVTLCRARGADAHGTPSPGPLQTQQGPGSRKTHCAPSPQATEQRGPHGSCSLTKFPSGSHSSPPSSGAALSTGRVFT